MTRAVTTIPQAREVQAARPPEMLRDLGEIERVAKACAASGYYKDVRDASQAVVKMLAGREMGVGPIQALAGIHIVEGKPTAGANLIAANVKRSGKYDYRVVRRDDEACVLSWFESGTKVGESSFTVEDAKRAGLWGRASWAKYPRAMLFARALTEGVRVYCPDAAGGVVYTAEELRPELLVDEEGLPEVRDVTPPAPAPAPAMASPAEGGSGAAFAVSESQRKRMFAKAKARFEALGIADADPVGLIKSVLGTRGLASTKEIASREEYEAACEGIDAWSPPPSADDFDTAELPPQPEANPFD